MIQPWITVLVAILYISVLFAVASYGDRKRVFAGGGNASRPNIYALSLAVYCTTWTFFGSVGLAATNGVNFLAIYLGPVLVVTIGYPVMRRIIALSKEERITSVADFLASRYGKNSRVAAVAAIIAVIGTIPYIALQLKAIASSVDTLVTEFSHGFPIGSAPFGDITLFVAVTLALFAVLFGTRHADATEHQHGLMLAIAMESVIKLIAFLCVGAFVTWVMFDGFGDLVSRASQNQQVQEIVARGFDASNFLILTFLSLIVFLLLPRQFHVAVVENNSDAELKRARWLFPLYLVAINLFVIPIAIAGMLSFGIGANADDYVLLLPILEGQRALGLLVFLGGLSAGTAMVIVASVALAIMISNDLVLPFLLKSSEGSSPDQRAPVNMERRILNIRRTAIFAVLAFAFVYYSVADDTAALASIGLVSFAAIAQLAPAFFIGMIWRRANARGAMLGMTCGFAVWAYCLLLPTLIAENSALLVAGPFGIAALRPESLFSLNISPLANGVIWSLAVNAALLYFGSRSRQCDVQEAHQAARFFGFQDNPDSHGFSRHSAIRMQHLTETLGRYLGKERAQRAFSAYLAERKIDAMPNTPVDSGMLRFSEQLLASAVGTSSSRLVHSLLIQRHESSGLQNLQLLDDASRAIQFNRDMLQTAFDQLEQGITVFDGKNRLASWNRQFRRILNLPDRIGQAGLDVVEVCEAIVGANLIEQGCSGAEFARKLLEIGEPWQITNTDTGKVIEISTSAMPQGGVVVSWHDITERVHAAEALRDANETLERRVEERTRELEEAKQQADQANASKTRFLAAAGHDIVQPLNAAKLYATTLIEKMENDRNAQFAENIGKSLGSVEEILGSILAISRLDSASPEINISEFPLRRITDQLEIEFEPIAENAGLELVFVHSSKWVRSDPALLRRLLQNLISNAIKFTINGKVLIGTRRRGNDLEISVHDTGIGIKDEDQNVIFGEFTRLNAMDGEIPGLGLGLSIVQRISNLLGHEINISSIPNHGTRISLTLETANAGAETESVTPLKTAKSQQLAGLRIVCIDNEQTILNGMEALLTHWGCEVACARDETSARDAIAKMDQEPDVLIVDYHLDNATGTDVFGALAEEFSTRPTGILVTADRSEMVKQEAAQIGMALLNKPLKPAALRALLSQRLLSSIAAE